MTSTPVNNQSDARHTGMVKWFNNKAGFGFITTCGEGDKYSGKDIFVHYTSIRVSNIQYKYLVQGEYVDFTVVDSESDAHEYQATDVCGVKGGSIMCETRRTLVQARDSSQAPRTHKYAPLKQNNRIHTDAASDKPKPRSRSGRAPAQVDSDGFTRVQSKRTTKTQPTAK